MSGRLLPVLFSLVLASGLVSCAPADTSDIDELRRDIEESITRIDSLEENNATLRGKLQQATAQLQLHEIELAQSASRVKRLCDDLVALRDQSKEVERKVDDMVVVLAENGIDAGPIVRPNSY